MLCANHAEPHAHVFLQDACAGNQDANPYYVSEHNSYVVVIRLILPPAELVFEAETHCLPIMCCIQDYTGAFKCMMEGDSRVAWVKHTTMEDYQKESGDLEIAKVRACVASLCCQSFFPHPLHSRVNQCTAAPGCSVTSGSCVRMAASRWMITRGLSARLDSLHLRL